MGLKQAAGNVKLNGTSYKLFKDPKTDEYAYQRKSVPKYQLKLSNPNATAAENNLIEYQYSAKDGYGDAVQTPGLDRYHYAENLYMEHDNEAVQLPAPSIILTAGANNVGSPVASSFELVINENDATKLVTYILQDCRASYISSTSAATISKTFEAQCTPTDSIVVDNVAYVAMGSNFRHLNIISVSSSGGFPLFSTGYIDPSGLTAVPSVHNYASGDLIRIANCNQPIYNGIWKVSATGLTTTSFRVDALAYTALAAGTNISGTTYKIDKRYVRKFDGGVWSRDDNNYLSIIAVTNAAGIARFQTSAGHGYTVGQHVYLVNMSVDAYNSMTTADVSTLYTITNISAADMFDCAAMPYAGFTATGHVNAQDSDIHAEHFCVAGDLLIRGYKDATEGWVTSRVDVVGSNPMLDADYTAGIGTVGVGDANSKITDLIGLGNGEVVMKAEGVFTYKKEFSAFTNEIPELAAHRHPHNGRNSCEHKGWVYIPTSIGLLRYRNGQTVNVTPGKNGQQKYISPVLIGAVAGDAERLYASTVPFRNFQNKGLFDFAGRSKIYVDYNNAGSADPHAGAWFDDFDTDLNGLTVNGYIYFGATQPWHSMYVEIDDIYNTLGTAYSGLSILGNSSLGAQYWNGSTWASRNLAAGGLIGDTGAFSGAADFTRSRDTSTVTANSFAVSGDIAFLGTTPSDWVVGGVTPLGTNLGTTSDMYWTRIKMSAAITTSVIIKRIIAGLHDPNEASPFENTDNGHFQLILEMKEDQGKQPIWHTMGVIRPTAYGVTGMSGLLNAASAAGSRAGSLTSSPSHLAIIQPNVLRSGLTGSRFLLQGSVASIVWPLGNKQDPTEDGLYFIPGNFFPAGLTMPETDCGLPNTDKELREIDFDLRGIDNSLVTVWWKTDGGPWTGGITPTSFPIKIADFATPPVGQQFAVALKIAYNSSTTAVLYAPRLMALPLIRVVPRPEMTEYITMSLELDADTMLPGMIDRREEKTSYTALKALAETTSAIDYVDTDESTAKAHVMQISKKMVHSSDQRPRSVADIVLLVAP